MKTYRKKKILLGQSLGICEGTIELGKFVGSVYESSSEVNAKVRWVIDLGSIYIKKESYERENSHPGSSKILSRWIRIAL